jgi:hypothetical protein
MRDVSTETRTQTRTFIVRTAIAPTAAMLIACVVKGGEGRVQGWTAVADLPTMAGGGHFPDDAA